MRKFAVLGASALVLALGVAQASASPQRPDAYGYFTQNPYWGESTAEMNGTAQATAVQNRAGLSDFRAQAADSSWQAPSQINPLLAHRGR
jgi:hypothetical protein